MSMTSIYNKRNVGKAFSFLLITLGIGLVAMRTGIFWDNTTFVSAMGGALYDNGITAGAAYRWRATLGIRHSSPR